MLFNLYYENDIKNVHKNFASFLSSDKYKVINVKIISQNYTFQKNSHIESYPIWRKPLGKLKESIKLCGNLFDIVGCCEGILKKMEDDNLLTLK